MTLDAHVHCTCFRDRRLLSPPPIGIDVYLEVDGARECRNNDLESQIAFDAWNWTEACEHELGLLISHHIGNIALVGAIRSELSHQPDDFPLLLSKVVYNGTHCGDHIERELIVDLRSELGRLDSLSCVRADREGFIRNFHQQMTELILASDQTGYPIAF